MAEMYADDAAKAMLDVMDDQLQGGVNYEAARHRGLIYASLRPDIKVDVPDSLLQFTS